MRVWLSGVKQVRYLYLISQPYLGRLTNRVVFLSVPLKRLSVCAAMAKCDAQAFCLGSQEPISPASGTLAGLVPDLQHLLFWMSNSIELLYFIQQKCPLYMQSLEEELDVTGRARAAA